MYKSFMEFLQFKRFQICYVKDIFGCLHISLSWFAFKYNLQADTKLGCELLIFRDGQLKDAMPREKQRLFSLY